MIRYLLIACVLCFAVLCSEVQAQKPCLGCVFNTAKERVETSRARVRKAVSRTVLRR